MMWVNDTILGIQSPILGLVLIFFIVNYAQGKRKKLVYFLILSILLTFVKPALE